VLIKI
jgi:hypothetical protein